MLYKKRNEGIQLHSFLFNKTRQERNDKCYFYAMFYFLFLQILHNTTQRSISIIAREKYELHSIFCGISQRKVRNFLLRNTELSSICRAVLDLFPSVKSHWQQVCCEFEYHLDASGINGAEQTIDSLVVTRAYSNSAQQAHNSRQQTSTEQRL